MARSLSHVFRADSEDNGSKSGYVSSKKAQTMTSKELLERYNPKDSKTSVAKRLKELSDGNPFIVFDSDNKVVIDASVRLLEDLLEGHDPVETTFIEECPVNVYRVGERPDNYVLENPLYPGQALRYGEVCSKTGKSWKDISKEIRQLLYLAVSETNEIEHFNVVHAVDIIEDVQSGKWKMTSIRSRCPQASLLFDQQQKTNQLPTLLLSLGTVSSTNRSNNPFGVNSTY